MGDLIRREGNRGQLLIITALSLAVLLSVLTLTLNTAVFGGVYTAQTDDGPQAKQGAIQYEDAVRRGIAGLIPTVNDRYEDYNTSADGLASATANWSEMAEREYARDSIATNATVKNVSFSTRVVQNTTQDFTDNSSDGNWTVAEDVSNASGYDMYVSDEEKLADAESSTCINGSGNCLTLTVTNASATWQLFVYDDDGDIAITVNDSDGDVSSYNESGSSVLINVTDGQFAVDGSNDSFTSFTDDAGGVDPPYTLTYSNAQNVEGTYNFTVTGRAINNSIAANDSYSTKSEGSSPWLDPRITAANVTVRYGSPTLAYRSEIRVTPGDTDG